MQHMQQQQQQQEQEHQQRTAQVARTLAAGLYGMLLAVVAQEVWRWWKKRAWSLTQFETVTKHHLQHLAAASSAGTSLEANQKHITVTLATWDAAWEVYVDPKWARQRLRLYGAQDRALEQFFNKLEEEMAELSLKRHNHAKQLVVFFGAATIGTGGGWGADAVLRACRKVVCRPRGPDQLRGRVVLVDEHRTSRVSSAVNGQQPCEVELNTLSATRPAGWKPPAGQVEPRLVRPAWSQERGQPVRGLVWCPVVPPRQPPQAPCSSQAATQPAASEPGPNTPPPAKRSKPAAEPTKGKGKAAKAKPAPQPGRWLDRDCNAALNMQRIGESRWRPLELCYWPDQGALPAKGKEYPGLGYKRLRDKPPKAQKRQQQPAEAQSGWKVYVDPKWARQRLRLYGAKDRALEQFFKKVGLKEEMAQVSMQRHGHGKQLVVFFGAAGIGIGGGGTDQRRGRVVLVDEHRTTRVSSTVNGQQPCKEQLDHEQPTRRADWKPPAGQVDLRLLRPAWSQQRDQPVRGMMWCPVVAPCKPPQAPCSSHAATQAAASEPGPSNPPPAKRTKAKQAAEPTQPTKGKGKAQGKAAKAKPAPQPGRWLDRDCIATLNMQPIGESRVPTMYGAHRGWSSSRPNASAPPYITEKALSDWMSEGYVQALPGLTGNLFRQMVGAEAVMAALSVLQRQQGVEGGLAEIGVHHGTFLISMALLGKQGEHILALDLFEQGQDKNIDRSGNGRSDIMRDNLKAVNFSGNNHLTVHTGASTELNCAQFCGLLGGQPLRLFHIDGGHTADIVLNDLAFADCALADGGIVMMDDFSNLYWSGVLQGLVTYMNTYRGSTRLAPLLLAFNKFYLTTVSHHQQYLANVTAWPVWFDACTNNLNMKDGRNHCIQAPGLPHPTVSPPAKFNFTGFPVAIADWPMTYSGPELYKKEASRGRTMAQVLAKAARHGSGGDQVAAL
ncbi:hypothetical protein QJQ45_018026 [Haematococcus lacustris]|nr:hypothetical protein QJQ45_018026 [Haematococcus lacustris]